MSFNSDITNGVYTPTINNTTNVAASSAKQCSFIRIGDTVMVGGSVSIDPTATSVTTIFGISLPIETDLTLKSQLAGTAVYERGTAPDAGYSACIYAEVSANRANCEFTTHTDVSTRDWYFTFMYRLT